MKITYAVHFILLASSVLIKANSSEIFVTPYRACRLSCSGDISNPYDNILFALQSINFVNLMTTIILLGNSATEHYLLPREIDEQSSDLLYNFSNQVKFILEDVQIKPLFCDEALVQTNLSLLSQCINRDQSLTIVFKPMEITLTIMKKISIQNIIFDWSESSQSVDSSDICALTRKRCCNKKDELDNVDCNPKFYTKQPANINPTYNLIELGPKTGADKQLFFNFITLKNFRDKTLKSFIQTNGNDPFGLIFQNSLIEDVTFGRGLISHIGSREEVLNSNIQFINLNFTKYNYWNREEEPDFSSWKEGYLIWVEKNYKGSIAIINSHFYDMNAASMHQCDRITDTTSNYFRHSKGSKSDIWDRYHDRASSKSSETFAEYEEEALTLKSNSQTKESSVIYFERLDGELTIQNSSFEKIIGVYGSVIHINDCTHSSIFNFIDTRFHDNFGMQGFANVLIVNKIREQEIGEDLYVPAKCPLIKVQNCEFTNSKGCPGSFGNVGFICYWDTVPSDTSALIFPSHLTNGYYNNIENIFKSPQIQISHSKFYNNTIPLSNSLAIVGSYFTSLADNEFRNNGGTTAEIIHYSLNNSNFLEKKSNQSDSPYYEWQLVFSSLFFGQSSVVYLDRLFTLKSTRNIFQGNWGPWEGSQALAVAVTIRNWIPTTTEFLTFKDDLFIDHAGIPPQIAEHLVEYGTVLKNNSYMPPLIAISYDPTDSSYFFDPNTVQNSSILFDGVEFRNNTVSLDINEGCEYNSDEIRLICSIMKKKKRYLTGFVKFLSETELREEDSVDSVYLWQRATMNFTMINSKIVNNILLTEGCFFSTLWAETYVLDNLIIQNNRINPYANDFIESAELNEPSIDLTLRSPDGMFCGFKRESLKDGSGGISFTATNLRVVSNTGTIFNLYPQESSTLIVSSSIFIKNIAPYGSMVNIFETSKVVSSNNIFIENENALGIFFTNSHDASLHTIATIYLRNNGKHASLTFINDQAQLFEVLNKNYWNTIQPFHKTFKDKFTPQGGLYFLQSAQVDFLLSEFKENYAYAGFLIAHRSTISFTFNNITDHYIYGNSVIGNIYSSTLHMQSINIENNSLTSLSSFDSLSSIIILEKTEFNFKDFEIFRTSAVNQGGFLFATKSEGIMDNMKFDKFLSSNSDSLIRLDFSKIEVSNLTCNDITSLFKLSKSYLTLQNTLIQNLRLPPSSEFLINAMDTNLYISKLEYLGGYDYGNHFSLFLGSNNNIKIVDGQFLNAVSGASKIFELTNSVSFFVAKSKFHYPDDYTETIIFDLESSKEVNILECTFILPGQLIQASNVLSAFYFVGNVILTTSEKQNAKISETNTIYFLGNHFLSQSNNQVDQLPESQVQFLSCYGLITIVENTFISLLGSKGIIKVEALARPYNVNSSLNIFIDNIGSNGGAFHLDAGMFAMRIIIYPTIDIQDSIFLLNKAKNYLSLKGKGGAIYQTTSTLMIQVTRIKNSFFLQNSAQTIGGALFFDYMPPKIDINSIFRENYANRPNHIGSYPVKLSYYGQESKETNPYLPNQVFIEPPLTSDNNKLVKFENIPSGILVNNTHIFGLVDIFGQIVYDDDNSLLEIYPEGFKKENRHLFSSIVSIEAKNGLYILDNFKFTYKIDKHHNITLTSSAINDTMKIPLDVPIISKASLEVEIHFRKCGRGEYVLEQDNTTVCVECQPGVWQTSLQSNAASCKPCNDESTICLGGDNVGPKKGYWRLNETADIVLSCPKSLSCLGNEIKDQKNNILLDPIGKCEDGYQGNLCSNCIPGWAKTGDGSCTRCETNLWFYVRVVLTLSLKIALIVQGYRDTMNLCKQYSEDKVIKLNGAILIRILTNYLQLISIISQIPVTWPSLIRDVYDTTSEVSSINQNVFTIDCLFNSGEVFGIKAVFFKILLGCVGGFFQAFIGIIFWLIYFLIKKMPILKSKVFWNNIVTTVIVICYMSQPAALQSSFSFFHCTNLYREDTPVNYFSKDYNMVCWEGEHLYWTLGIGLPSLVIWSFILPFIVFNQIRKNKDNLTLDKVAKKYSFLYGGYTNSKYYWEFVIIIRKVIFIGIITGASFYSTGLQIYSSVILIMLFYFIEAISSPYSDAQINFLEKLSLLSAVTVNFCGLYFQLIFPKSISIDIIIQVIGLIANLIFLIVFLKFYYHIQIEKLKEKESYKKIIKKINNFCSFFEFSNRKNFWSKAAQPKESEMQQERDEINLINSEIKSINQNFDLKENNELISIKELFRRNSQLEEISCNNISGFESLSVNYEKEDVNQNDNFFVRKFPETKFPGKSFGFTDTETKRIFKTHSK